MTVRTLKLTIAYDGTAYAGWQVQRAGQQTIQGVLETSLHTILRERVRVIGSGRTDAGVHALAQVAHIRTRHPMPCQRLRWALNGVLPNDIAVRTIEEAPASFHARFDATRRRYRYQIVTDSVRLPFDRRYTHHVPFGLNLAAIRRETKALLGWHDVRAFCRAGESRGSSRRRITNASWRRLPGRLIFEIEANGFVHTMVRSIVGTLLDVGRGHRSEGAIRQLLRNGNRRGVGPTAPARGLCLIKVLYR